MSDAVFQLRRIQLETDFTIGRLYIATFPICWILEDAVREIAGQPVADWKIKHQTAIPYGKYKIVRTFSNRFQHHTPELLDVPGFTGIRIHPGNTAADTSGCLLPGRQRLARSVGESKLAYAEVLKWLDAVEWHRDTPYLEIIKEENSEHSV